MSCNSVLIVLWLCNIIAAFCSKVAQRGKDSLVSRELCTTAWVLRNLCAYIKGQYISPCTKLHWGNREMWGWVLALLVLNSTPFIFFCIQKLYMCLWVKQWRPAQEALAKNAILGCRDAWWQMLCCWTFWRVYLKSSQWVCKSCF